MLSAAAQLVLIICACIVFFKQALLTAGEHVLLRS
jgi:hypothetical protein